MKRLSRVEVPLADFFASGVLRLSDKLGPILWRLSPPSFRFDADRLASFFRLLPRDTEAAARSPAGTIIASRGARRRRSTSSARCATRSKCGTRPSAIRGTAKLLRRHDVGLVVADTAGRWPLLEDVTSDFVYARQHGDVELYASGYTADALAVWARRVRAWSRGRTPPAPTSLMHGTPCATRATCTSISTTT